jgi:cytochrome c peroxidase
VTFQETDVILDFPAAPSSATLTRPRIGMVQLHDALWRITRPNGEVLGYVERFEERGSDRFRSKRLIASRRSFIGVGEFWTLDEAIACFG